MAESKRVHERRWSGYLTPGNHKNLSAIATSEKLTKSQALNKAVALLVKNTAPKKP